MINQGNNVPDNKMALLIPKHVDFTYDQVKDIFRKPTAKRDWFEPNFYNCLPLTIGNQYGIEVVPNFSFNVLWDGEDFQESLHITRVGDFDVVPNFTVSHHFGHGILNISLPCLIRTPPGVNLMTINPPNYILDNATVMTGVVETDNLRFSFTINIRIEKPNVITHFPAGKPICTLLPIPRYFADQFEIIDANSVFSKEVMDEELDVFDKHMTLREESLISADKTDKRDWRKYLDKLYMKGIDILGNKFPDHQR